MSPHARRALSGITPTRNRILANTRDKCVVMLDDDVKRAGWVRLEKQNSTYDPLPNEASWLAEMVRLFDLTEKLKYPIGGVATQSAPRAIYPWKPILFRSYVAARYLFWENSHWTDAGGCAANRTQLLELRCIKLLVAMYPGMIRRVRRGGSTYSVDLDF